MSPATAMNRVLIVVDDALLVADLTEALADGGYSVRAASSCASALEQAAASELEVALVGVRLPDGLGGTLLPRLRALRPHARAILLTADSTVDAASAAVKAGAFAYLAKSATSEQVLLQVGEALEASHTAYEQEGQARSTDSAERLAAIKAMTAGVSHELRNPLNAASLQLSLLERGLEALEVSLRGPLLKTVGLVREEMARLGHVIEDFLLMANPRPLQRRWLDVSALTHLVLDFLAKDAERQLVHVSRHVGQGQMAMVDE